MNCIEQALAFECVGEQLVGVISSPKPGTLTSGIGVVIVVGGPQYRAGSHRQFVLLARALAAQGHQVLRFDYRGMGDSTGAARTFEEVGEDIHAAIRALRAHCPRVREITLWGLCDGASAALLYLHEFGPRAGVSGLCLVNPWVRTAESLAKTQVKHYYLRRLRQPEFWAKLVRGRTGLQAFKDLAGNLRQATARRQHAPNRQLCFQDRMALGWQGFSGRVLLLLCGEDYVAKEFIDHAKPGTAWNGLLCRHDLARHDLPEVDHTFSSAAWRDQAETLTAQWLARSGKLSHSLAGTRAQ
jgi:exosortase A-associated hydrolase 1